MVGPLASLRCDQVGSLLRPAALKGVYARHGEGRATDADLGQAQDGAIRAAIGRQEALGLPVVTDGEFRRLNFQDSFGSSVSGFAATVNTIQFEEQVVAGARPLQRWDSGYNREGPPVVSRRPALERLRLVRNQPLEEYLFARDVANRPVTVTLIGPDRIIQRFDYERSESVYRDVDAFIADVVAIERQIIAGLVEAGCPYIQIDAPSYTAYVDPPSLEQMRARGEDPDANLERSIEADNAVIAGFPGTTFGLHICRGNQRSMWHREGAYDAIAERLFGRLHHDRFLLEYDSERAGGFEPLRFVRPGKTAVLGLISSKVSELEPADGIKRRIDDASRFLPLEQLALSPQCGFASSIPGNALGEEDQWRKLALVRSVAEDVWGDL
jgi:5-methyltetrahydropteroyltriglutamate--homocysteine methyltransferase